MTKYFNDYLDYIGYYDMDKVRDYYRKNGTEFGIGDVYIESCRVIQKTYTSQSRRKDKRIEKTHRKCVEMWRKILNRV